MVKAEVPSETMAQESHLKQRSLGTKTKARFLCQAHPELLPERNVCALSWVGRGLEMEGRTFRARGDRESSHGDVRERG